MNTMKTTVLLGTLTGLFLALGYALGRESGMLLALIFTGIFNFGAYFWSDSLVLRQYNAQPVSEAEAPELYAIVARLAAKAQIPMPRLYVLPDQALNAFATGRNPAHAAVAATEGILRAMTPDELEGVLGHELSHVLNRDTLTSTIAATLAGAITSLARMFYWFGGSRDDEESPNPIAAIAMVIAAPIAAFFIQMAISRSREYAADASGARLVGTPNGLASALRKLQVASGEVPPMANATPATAHLFIVNPLSAGFFTNLVSTHPPLEKRIERLEHMGYNG